MKTYIFHALYAGLAVILFSGCYSDKGNYDYQEESLNKVNVSFTPNYVFKHSMNTFEFAKPMGKDNKLVTISANISQTISKDLKNLEATWILSGTKKDTIVQKGDTISGDKFALTVPLLGNNKDTQYKIKLKISDSETTLDYYYALAIASKLAFREGWFVLNGATGQTRLSCAEVLDGSTNNKLDTPAYLGMTTNPFEKAIDMFYTVAGDQSYSAIMSGSQEILAVVDPDITAYRPFTYQVRWQNQDIVPSGYAYKKLYQPSDSKNYSTSVMLCRDGHILISGGYCKFFEVKSEDGVGDYNIDELGVRPDDDYYLMWDKTGQRFLYYHYMNLYSRNSTRDNARISEKIRLTNIDYSNIPSADRPAGKTPVYIYEYGESKTSDYGMKAIFVDNAGKHYLYTLQAIQSEDNGKEGSDAISFSIKASTLDGFPFDKDNSIFTFSKAYSSNIFIGSGSKIYRYNFATGRLTELLDLNNVEGAKGLTIRDIAFRYQGRMDIEKYSSNWYYLGIGADNGSKGIFMEIKLTNGGDVDKSYGLTHIYSGYGPIKRIIYAQPSFDK